MTVRVTYWPCLVVQHEFPLVIGQLVAIHHFIFNYRSLAYVPSYNVDSA